MRTCEYCGKQFERKSRNESWPYFATKKYCGRRCHYHDATMSSEERMAHRKASTAKYRAANRGKARAYYMKNRERILGITDEILLKRVIDSIRRKLTRQIRKNLNTRIRHALRGLIKVGRTHELLGCSIEDFKIYLESKFDVGMSWDNYGEVWEVDHIMPCAIFDLSKPEHQKRCFHFSNLQPLKCTDNRRKQDKVLTNQYPLI